LLQLIFDECRTTGDLLSPPITLDRIAAHLESHKGTAKTIIFRLTQKGFLKREASATGRGGFTRFRLEKDLYQAILIRETEYKRVTNGVQTGNKEVTQRVTQRVTSAPSSSSVLDLENLKTTTSEQEAVENGQVLLPSDWESVDFSSLTEFGFSRSHLIQLARHGKLSTSEVQDSIYFFAFDLKRNGKGRELKGPPVNFFMGILRKGLPYAPPENYESPETEARRRYIEGKRRLEDQRQADERELQELEFAEWGRGLSPEEINSLVPDVVRHAPKAREHSLRAYFNETVWPARRLILPGTEAERAEIAQQIENSLMGK
jgi:predicted transcriptional regulator